MGYKIKGIIDKNKKYIIMFLIIWILMEILLTSPLAVSIAESKKGGNFIEIFFTEIATLSSFKKIFSSQVIGIFGKTTLYMTILYLIVLCIGLIKSKPKNEFTDIEHGSSDWSENGAQYKVLSKNKGIILAENNYLPVNKLGNVNVLIVGRFWCW